jgi:hypothetical protein
MYLRRQFGRRLRSVDEKICGCCRSKVRLHPSLGIALLSASSTRNSRPDDRWIAYQSNESGEFEVYVRRFTPPGAGIPVEGWTYQVSKDGGTRPLWAKDGRELI